MNPLSLLLIPVGMATAVVGFYLVKVFPWQKWAAELTRAIEDRDTERFRRMLDDDPASRFMRRSTTLLSGYAKRGDIENVRYMLDNGTEGADKAFVSAAGDDQVEMMEWLLRRGVPIDYFEGNWPTALMIAAQIGNETAVRFLIEHGANPNIRKWDGTTALTLARRRRHDEIARFLEEHGAVT